MSPRIEHLTEKKLVGQYLSMSLSQNKTGQLWGQFAPRIREIENRVSADKISLQVYPPSYFRNFKPGNEFVRWAAIEVKTLDKIPDGMCPLVLSAGLYAVFDYKGSSTDNSIFQYIFSTWIPQSEYQLDDRPHFEVLGPNYRNNDPESEEEIWIPIRKI